MTRKRSKEERKNLCWLYPKEKKIFRPKRKQKKKREIHKDLQLHKPNVPFERPQEGIPVLPPKYTPKKKK